MPSLKPGEVLLRVSYVGVCGTDLEVLEGTLGYYRSGLAQYPIVPGHESSGTVVAVGPRVTGFNEGDRVVVECIQGCGECPRLPSRRSHPLPRAAGGRRDGSRRRLRDVSW